MNLVSPFQRRSPLFTATQRTATTRLDKKVGKQLLPVLLNEIFISYPRLLLTQAIDTIDSFFPHRRSDPLEELYPPRQLKVGRLPEPPFYTAALPRYFWRPRPPIKEEGYEGALLKEEGDRFPEKLADEQKILSRLSSLPCKGVVRQDNQGFVYLDISNAFIDLFLSELQEKAERPPYFGDSGPFGAHIPLITAREWQRAFSWSKMQDLSKELSFTVTGCYAVVPEGWPEMEKVWIITVASQELEALRERCWLPAKLGNHLFHIVAGVQKKEKEN